MLIGGSFFLSSFIYGGVVLFVLACVLVVGQAMWNRIKRWKR